MKTFRRRDDAIVERMDDPQCDEAMLFRTYRQFAQINPLLARWSAVYARLIRPVLQPGVPATLLDVGFGGGDIPHALDRWARRDGFELRITAIDPDPRANRFAATWPHNERIEFRMADTATLLAEGALFDVVISNAVLHHLNPDTLAGFFADTRALARRLVVHNDTVRSAAAYLLYSVFVAPWLRHSFAAEDGRLTVRRSYRPDELRALAPGWRIERLAPFRQLVCWQAPP